MATVAFNPMSVAGAAGAGLAVNPEGVASAGSRVAAAGLESLVPAVGPVSPAAGDPVSVAVAATLSARVAALLAHGEAAAVIKEHHAGLLWASADAYISQDSTNSAGLAPGSGAPAQTTMIPLPPAPVLPLPPSSVPAPVFGAPPGGGEAIAALIHGGSPDPWYAAAHQLRRYAAELDDTGDQLRSVSTQLPGQWWSRAGEEADIAVRKLGNWYHDHAGHAKAAATTTDTQADNYWQAQAAIPTPKQFQRVNYALANARMLAATKPMYAPLVTQLEAQRAELETQATSHYANYQAAASANLAGDPIDPAPRPQDGVQALDEHDGGDGGAGAEPPQARGLPPVGLRPPVPGELTPGPASRPSEQAQGGESLWDEKGGEWRYFPGDRWHNPHWDYNPHDVPNRNWDNIPVGDLPPRKEIPDPRPPPGSGSEPPIVSLPPLSPEQKAAGIAGGIAGFFGGLWAILNRLQHPLSITP